MTFSNDLNRIAKKRQRQADGRVRRIALAALRQIDEGLPIDKGTFAANWVVSFDTIDRSFDPSKTEADIASTLSIATAMINSKAKCGTTICIGNKTLPGLADGETWVLSTDDPMQAIAKTIIGKFGGVSQLSFDVPYDPILLRRLVAHVLTNFTVEVIYNDTALDHIYAINVFNCSLVNPGNTSGTADNSAPTMTVTLQPRGGVFADMREQYLLSTLCKLYIWYLSSKGNISEDHMSAWFGCPSFVQMRMPSEMELQKIKESEVEKEKKGYLGLIALAEGQGKKAKDISNKEFSQKYKYE